MLRRSGRLAAAAATDLAAAVAHSASASMPEAKRARVKPAGTRGRGARASPPAAGDSGSEEAGAGAQVPAVRKREAQLYDNGCKCVIGIDEAGRGPLAGPVVTAACFLPMDVQLAGLTDSKLLDEAQRDALYDEIVSNPRIQFATCIISRERIDEINILAATMEGMARAARELAAKVAADYALVDGNRLPADMPCEAEAVVRGDLLCACISAASIVAKVTRDRIMLQLDKEFPQYGFAQHKGYGVAAHVAAIFDHGPCPHHRVTFNPVKTMLAKQAAQAAAAPPAGAPRAKAKQAEAGGRKRAAPSSRKRSAGSD